jgi:hypothetical protein
MWVAGSLQVSASSVSGSAKKPVAVPTEELNFLAEVPKLEVRYA